MKLLRIIPSLNPAKGGPVQGIHNITPYMAEMGISTTVITLDSPSSTWIKSNNSFSILGLGPTIGTYGYRKNLPLLIREIAKKHDAVIVHGIWQYHAFATWRALHKSTIPYYVYPHGMLDPWFKKRYPLKHLKKWIYWPWADYRVLRDAKGVLFTTHEECRLARKSFWLYNINEIVAGYGTSRPSYDPIASRNQFLSTYPSLVGKQFLLFMGRIHPKKGIDILIRAFALIYRQYPSLHLVIAGPDDVGLKSSLQALSKELQVDDRITWTGMLTGQVKWGAYYSSTLFCLPSHQENFGIVLAEALSCSIPACISHHVNISSEVSSYRAGIVHENSVEDTCRALQEWLSYTQSQRDKIKESAYKLFLQKFDFASVANNLVSILSRQ